MRTKTCLLALGAVQLSLMTANTAVADCKQANVTIVDETTGDRGKMILFCEDDSIDFPDAFSLSFVNWSDGQLCTAIKDCANVSQWSGSVSVSSGLEITGEITFSDLEEIELSGETSADVISIEFKTSFKQTNNYCKPIKKECISF